MYASHSLDTCCTLLQFQLSLSRRGNEAAFESWYHVSPYTAQHVSSGGRLLWLLDTRSVKACEAALTWSASNWDVVSHAATRSCQNLLLRQNMM